MLHGIAFRWCNGCGGKRFRLFKELPIPFPSQIHGDRRITVPHVGKQLLLQYRQCSACGLVGINPLTTFSDIHRTFDGERNIVAWADCDFDWYAREKRRTIQAVYEQYDFERYRHFNRILDVGCGPGVSLDFLVHEKGWDAIGIDPDLHSVRIAKERFGVRIKHGFIDTTSQPSESVDLIILDNSIEHTLDPLGTILSVYRVLRSGGGAFIATPNCDSLGTIYANANAHWGHWFLFSPRTLVEMLERVGFRTTRLFAVQNTLDKAVADRGVDIDEFRAELSVRAEGPEASRLARTASILSDYFHVFAEKPGSWSVESPRASELRSIAEASLIERSSLRLWAGFWSARLRRGLRIARAGGVLPTRR